MADNEDEQGPEQEEAEEVEKQEEQGVQEEVEEEEQSEEGEAADNDNDDESDKFVSGVKESPELVEESLRSEYYSGISEEDRENSTAIGPSAQCSDL